MELIKASLFEHYEMLKNVFKQYSSNGGDPFTMGSNSFSDFINDCNIIDEQNCLRSEVDMCFITANLSGPKDKANPKRSLLRFQFLEVVVALSVSKFSRNGEMTPHQGVLKMLSEYILPNATWHDAQGYRNGQDNGRLYTYGNDVVLKAHLIVLQEVFDMYSGSQQKNVVGQKKRMAIAEFNSMVDDIGFTDETLASREVRIAVLYSKQTHVNEIKDYELVRSLDFNEFLEACARIADMKDMTGMYSKLTNAEDTSGVKRLLEDIGESSDGSWCSGDDGNLTLKLQVYKNRKN